MAMLYPQQKIFMEVDVRSSKDDVSIALHDSRLNRTIHGDGECFNYSAKKLLAMRCKDVPPKRKESEVDFTTMTMPSNPHAVLWNITAATDNDPGDYRIATIDEILELTRLTNKYLIHVGRPVGICLDLKAPQALPGLVRTLNDFAGEHPKAIVPMIALGVTSRVGLKDMKKSFWEKLDEPVQRFFYETPDRLKSAVHTAKLNITPGRGLAGKVARVLSTSIMNMAFPWNLIGDHGMIGAQPEDPHKGLRVAGNNYCLTSVEQVRAAASRQDLIWVDNVWDAVRTMHELQQEGQIALAAPQLANLQSPASAGKVTPLQPLGRRPA